MRQFENRPFFPSRRGNEHNEVSQSVTKCHKVAHELSASICGAVEARTLFVAALGDIDPLTRRGAGVAHIRDFAGRAMQVLDARYLPALVALRAELGDEVAALIGNREARLGRGYAAQDTDRNYHAFIGLLAEYEVLVDCRDVAAATERLRRRVRLADQSRLYR